VPRVRRILVMLADLGIITLCDENYFPGSVQESQPCMVACYDLGMTREQRTVAAARNNLHILPLPDDPIIDRIRLAMSLTPPLAKLNKRVWPLWICPVLIQHAPFRDVIWMDCDLVVLRNLSDLFAAIEAGPLFTPENKAPQFTANHAELYDLMPIRRAFDPKLPTVNAGVSGWRKPRDAAAIDAYLLPVERAIDDKRIRDAITWHDQGALIWAIQHCGLEHCVASTPSWNLCVDNTPIAHRSIPWAEDFLGTVRREVPAAHVVHWNGNEPPWSVRRMNNG
jgi:hypothetical protein